MKEIFTIFLSIFLAELGDKTQLATLMFATDRSLSRWAVFGASAAALTLSSFLAVMLGDQIRHWISPQWLKAAAGVGFVVIGVLTLWSLKGEWGQV